MSGSSNFQQFNPPQANQETDSAYTADTLRSGGIPNTAIMPSLTANKLFYQVTTFVAALANAFAAKGYVLSDTNLTTLAGVLAAVVTQVDLVAALALYAPLTNPALSGVPTAPTAAVATNSTQIASTAYVKAQGFLTAITNAMVVSALGFTPVQQGGGAGQGGNKIFLGWDGRLRLQVDSSDEGDLAFLNDLAPYAPLASPVLTGVPQAPTPATGNRSTQIPTTQMFANEFASSLGANGYQKFPSGLILQWGSIAGSSLTPGGSVAITFPIAFAGTPYSITIGPDASIGSNTTAWFAADARTRTGFSLYQAPGTAFATLGNHSWMAVGV